MPELEQDLQHVLDRTGSLWKVLAGSNIFITGASGFVGTWLVESFLSANRHLCLDARLFLLTRNRQAFCARKPHVADSVGVDICEGDLQTFAFPPQSIDYIIHAAVDHSAVAANTEGTRRVLEMARLKGTRRLLYTSSGAVYGPQPGDIEKLPEEFVGAPRLHDPYANAKRESEALCMHARNSVIARLFTFVGPYLPVDRNFAIGNFIRNAAADEPIRIEGDGTPLRSYLYAADLAIWLWTLLLKGESGRPYNVGSDQAISILDLARTVERVCETKRGISVAQSSAEGTTPTRYVPSTERAKTEMALQPWITLEEGIRRMFRWHKQHRAYASMK